MKYSQLASSHKNRTGVITTGDQKAYLSEVEVCGMTVQNTAEKDPIFRVSSPVRVGVGYSQLLMNWQTKLNGVLSQPDGSITFSPKLANLY